MCRTLKNNMFEKSCMFSANIHKYFSLFLFFLWHSKRKMYAFRRLCWQHLIQATDSCSRLWPAFPKDMLLSFGNVDHCGKGPYSEGNHKVALCFSTKSWRYGGTALDILHFGSTQRQTDSFDIVSVSILPLLPGKAIPIPAEYGKVSR